MRQRTQIVFVVVLTVLSAGTLLLLCSKLFTPSAQITADGTSALAATNIAKIKAEAIKIDTRPQNGPVGILDQPVSEIKAEVTSGTEESDDRLLGEVVSGLMEFIEVAARNKDWAEVGRLVAKLQSIKFDNGAGRHSAGAQRLSSAKRRILELLESGGVDGLAYVMDFLGDSDVSIAQSAEKLVFKQLNNHSLPDYDRADIVVEAAKEMTQRDSVTRLLNEFVKMRHSVGVAALQEIYSSGSDQAKEQLPRVMRAFTRDSSISTAGELSEWLKQNPDSYMDNWFYGKESLDTVSRPASQ